MEIGTVPPVLTTGLSNALHNWSGNLKKPITAVPQPVVVGYISTLIRLQLIYKIFQQVLSTNWKLHVHVKRNKELIKKLDVILI